MSLQKTVVWNEGMFIAPQHFQQLDRALRSYVNNLFKLCGRGHDFGFAELEIDKLSLERGQVNFPRATGVFPDGTFFATNENLILRVPSGTAETIVYVEIPDPPPSGTEVGDRLGHFPYISEDIYVDDISNQNAAPVEVTVAGLGLILRLESQVTPKSNVIPVARILRCEMDGRVTLDRNFIPPILTFGASEALRDRVSEVFDWVKLRATAVRDKLEAIDSSGNVTVEIINRIEFTALNQSLFALQNIMANPYTPVRQVYAALGELTVALEANKEKMQDEELVFDPYRPDVSFFEVFSKLRNYLSATTGRKRVELDWNTELFEQRRLLRAILPEDIHVTGKQIVVSVSSALSREHLAKVVPKTCKIAGISSISSIVRLNLPSIKLTHVDPVGFNLPKDEKTAYFLLDADSIHLQRLETHTEALAMYVDPNIPILGSKLLILS